MFMGAMAALSLAACSPSYGPEPVDPEKEIDAAKTLVTAEESGAYKTFFKPAIGWVGDVMPFYDEASATYQMFYLQDWRHGGSIHPIWRAETKDFASFGSAALAIDNGATGEQDETIGTGSAIKGGDGKYYFFYTGEISTNYIEGMPRQAVLRASSTDLKTWTKDRSFKMISASPDYNYSEFRDPCVIWDADAGVYRMFVSSTYQGSNALAHYTSADLSEWTLQAAPLYRSTATFMECADVFKLGSYWYIIYSSISDPRTVNYIYKSGSLDDGGSWSEPAALDGRMYYAAKTAPSADGGRYLSGWCMTLEGDYDASGWGGAMVTHKLTQAEGGELTAGPVAAVSAKYSAARELKEVDMGGSAGGSAGTYDLSDSSYVRFSRLEQAAKITARIVPSSEAFIAGFCFAAADDNESLEQIKIIMNSQTGQYDLVYDRDQDGSVSQQNFVSLWSMREASAFDVEILIEKSVVVVYVNGSKAMSCRIYLTEGNPWTIFTAGGSASFENVTLSGQ